MGPSRNCSRATRTHAEVGLAWWGSLADGSDLGLGLGRPHSVRSLPYDRPQASLLPPPARPPPTPTQASSKGKGMRSVRNFLSSSSSSTSSSSSRSTSAPKPTDTTVPSPVRDQSDPRLGALLLFACWGPYLHFQYPDPVPTCSTAVKRRARVTNTGDWRRRRGRCDGRRGE